MASIDLTINVDEVIDAATRIKRVESALVGTTAVSTINKVLPRTYDSAAKKMLSGINLPRSDLDDQMSIEKASNPLKPQGAIVARRKTRRPNTMRRYLVGMILAQNTWSQGFVMSQVVKRARNPIPPGTASLPWKIRVGDKRRGIPAGQKARGIEVEVVKGRVKRAENWFLLPTKNGLLPARVRRNAEKRWGRKGKANYEVIYGPSVWQLFKAQIPGLREGVLADLRKTLDEDIRDEFLKALRK